jgi:hypothetical protein
VVLVGYPNRNVVAGVGGGGNVDDGADKGIVEPASTTWSCKSIESSNAFYGDRSCTSIRTFHIRPMARRIQSVAKYPFISDLKHVP